MADTIERVKILDDTIAVNSKVRFGVLIGGQNVTSQPFKAISSSASSMIFNIVVPSVETIMDRHLLMQATVLLRVNVNNLIAGAQPINYGVTDALAPFPLNQLIQNIQCSLNNNSITLQQSDVFDILLRMFDSEDLAKYDGLTPNGLDYLYDYSDGVMLNPFYLDLYSDAGTYKTTPFRPGTAANGFQPGPVSYTSFNNNILAYDSNRIANSGHYHKPRGQFLVDAIFRAASDSAAVAGGAAWQPLTANATTYPNVYVQFTVTEPLFLSPFLQGISSKEDHPGVFGVNALNFTINFSSDASRAWRSARFPNPAVTGHTQATPKYQTKAATLINVSNAQMLVKFYTPKQTLLDNPRCVVPYYEWQIFKTGQNSAMPPALLATAGDASTYGQVATATIPNSLNAPPFTSSNIQLQSIPERIIVFIRRVRNSNLTCCDTDAYLTIKSIRVNFNNQSGLLSTFDAHQLYEATITSGGIQNLTWDEFQGVTIAADGAPPAYDANFGLYNAWPYTQYGGEGAAPPGGAASAAAGIRLVPTTGSILSLAFGTTIQLSEDFYAPGSIGQFNLQVIVNAANLTKDTWSDYELVVLVQNPGVVITDRGSSSTFVGMLTKDSVLQTKDDSEHYTYSYMKHFQGGGFGHHVMSGLRWLHNHGVSAAKNFLAKHVNHPIANKAVEVANTLGYGMSGGKSNLQSRLM